MDFSHFLEGSGNGGAVKCDIDLPWTNKLYVQ